MIATAVGMVVILLARLIVANGQPAFVLQNLDPIAAGLILVSLGFGFLLTRRPLSIGIPDATNRRLLVVSISVFVLLAAAALLLIGTSPATPDEEVALFQAKLFSEFRIVGQYPPGLVDQMLLPLYQNNIILVGADGSTMAVYWPGWALLMTPFVWLGVPWLLGPAVAGLSVFLIGKLALLLAGARAGTIAVLLAVTSGAFLVNGMSEFPAGGHLALSLLYAWLLLRGTTRDYVLAGLVGGLALVLNNPFPHFVFALPWLLWLLADPVRRRRLIPLAVGYVPGLVVFAGWLMIQNSLRTHDSTAANVVFLSRLSLFVNIPTLAILSFRFWEFVRLWAWSAPGLLVLAWVGWRRTTENVGLRLLGASFVVTVILYVLFPASQGIGYGARYYHSAWGVLPILAAAPLATLGWERVRNLALAAAVVGLVLVVPLEMLSARSLANSGAAQIGELSQPGVNLCFIDIAQVDKPDATINNNPSTVGFIVLISQGQAADQRLVDRYFPGARLVVKTSFGSGYARP